jgi:23S rRNA (guanosine2251-2'-O)-methyltransferase
MAERSAVRRQLRGAAAIAEALSSGQPLQLVFVRAGPLSPEARNVLAACENAGVPIRSAGERELKRLSAVSAEQALSGRGEELLGLIGDDPVASLQDLLASPGAVWLVTDVAYPGNAGFAIRTAEVSGAAGIVVDASFDHTGRRRALRAAMRADRLFPVLFAKASEVVSLARAAGRRIIGIEDGGSRAPWQVDLTGPLLLVVGGEARGVPKALLDACECVVRIPMLGFIPSYNLQAAVAIVAGERLRQLSVSSHAEASSRVEGEAGDEAGREEWRGEPRRVEPKRAEKSDA